MGNNIRKLRKDDITKYYTMKRTLGTGSFAVVALATRKADGKDFAIKCIKKNKLNPEELAVVHDEVEIMHKINHPHCVTLYEMFETKKKLYMVMELLTGGELFDRIVEKSSYSEKEAADVIKDITSAIMYLHSIGVVHRDLKPENLIYRSKDMKSPVKITDFGLAKYRQGEDSRLMTTACGTPGYVAPEVLATKPYGPAVDMWSVGVILYILLCGFPPFYHESTKVLYKLIMKGQYNFPSPFWDNISASAKDLVKKLLVVDPAKRLTAAQVLKHPWIAQGKATATAFDAKHTARLQTMQAKKKLRRCVQIIIAVNRYARCLKRSAAAPAKA